MDDPSETTEETVDAAAPSETVINWKARYENADRVRDIPANELFPDDESIRYDGRREHPGIYGVGWLRYQVVCADGFRMSVQDSPSAFSVYDDDLVCTHVEVGFPSEVEPMLSEWVDDADNPTGTVYGYVPIGVVLAVIEKHGGRVGWRNPLSPTNAGVDPAASDACRRAA